MLIKKQSKIRNERGLAVFEIVPVLAMFILLINFSIGFFGAIHSGILNSIASRNYAFETFRNRANLNYIRDIPGAEADVYSDFGYRYHGTISEGRKGIEFYATKRAIKFSDYLSPGQDDNAVHNRKVAGVADGARASDVIEKDEFSSIWVRTLYGICLNHTCGD